MTDLPNRTHPARLPKSQQSTFLRKAFAYDTPLVDAGVPFDNAFPSGARIARAFVDVDEAFNATTSNLLDVGTSDDDDAFVDNVDVDLTAVGRTEIDPRTLSVSADTLPYVKYTQSGTAASAGSGVVVFEFIADK